MGARRAAAIERASSRTRAPRWAQCPGADRQSRFAGSGGLIVGIGEIDERLALGMGVGVVGRWGFMRKCDSVGVRLTVGNDLDRKGIPAIQRGSRCWALRSYVVEPWPCQCTDRRAVWIGVGERHACIVGHVTADMKRKPDDVRHGHPICEPLRHDSEATRVSAPSDRPDRGPANGRAPAGAGVTVGDCGWWPRLGEHIQHAGQLEGHATFAGSTGRVHACQWPRSGELAAYGQAGD